LDLPSFALANLIYGVVLGLWVAGTPRVRAENAFATHVYMPSFDGTTAESDEVA